jgi:hypothetical protein
MILKSFGCSFIWGSELDDEIPGKTPSLKTWPALLAKQLELDYQCHAWPGRGNLFISEQILNHAQLGDKVVVNWTYIDRFDYTDPANDRQWHTIRPSGTDAITDIYYRNFHSQYRDKLTSLQAISNAVAHLEQQNIPFLMTYQDHLLFETQWHHTPAIESMQQRLKSKLRDFGGDNFVKWAQAQGHPVTAQGHLLESGHAAAAAHLDKTGSFQ